MSCSKRICAEHTWEGTWYLNEMALSRWKAVSLLDSPCLPAVLKNRRFFRFRNRHFRSEGEYYVQDSMPFTDADDTVLARSGRPFSGMFMEKIIPCVSVRPIILLHGSPPASCDIASPSFLVCFPFAIIYEPLLLFPKMFLTFRDNY